jgi:hypothetical protein
MFRLCRLALRQLRARKIFFAGLLTALAISGASAQVVHTSYVNITGQVTTVVKAAPGILTILCLNTPTATSVITLFDNTSAAGTKIGTITVPATPQPVCMPYNVNFQIGLTINVATASSDITVGYQ